MQDSQYCTSAIVSIQFMIILNKCCASDLRWMFALRLCAGWKPSQFIAQGNALGAVYPVPTPWKGKSKSQPFAHTFALTGRRRLCTDTQGVALGYGGVALSGRHIPHKIRHLAAELCNEPCGASIVAHFARKVRGTNLWRIMQRIQLSPHFHLRAPHFASKVSYSASRQSELQCFAAKRAMLLCCAPSLILVSERGTGHDRTRDETRSNAGRDATERGTAFADKSYSRADKYFSLFLSIE